MDFVSTLIALLCPVVLIAALLNPLRPDDDEAPGARIPEPPQE